MPCTPRIAAIPTACGSSTGWRSAQATTTGSTRTAPTCDRRGRAATRTCSPRPCAGSDRTTAPAWAAISDVADDHVDADLIHRMSPATVTCDPSAQRRHSERRVAGPAARPIRRGQRLVRVGRDREQARRERRARGHRRRRADRHLRDPQPAVARDRGRDAQLTLQPDAGNRVLHAPVHSWRQRRPLASSSGSTTRSIALMTVFRLSVTSTDTFLPGMFPKRFAWPPDCPAPRSATCRRSAFVRKTVSWRRRKPRPAEPAGNGCWLGPEPGRRRRPRRRSEARRWPPHR